MADPLTRLPNRRQLDAEVGQRLHESRRSGTPVACAMLDIDHFKRFNDDDGHDADAVLRAVGVTLKEAVREDSLVYRYGGEEFLLLLPGMPSEQAEKRVEELRLRISELSVLHDGRPLGSVTVSAGLACAPEHCTWEKLVQTADAALLRAKREGRDQVVVAEARSGRAAA